MKWGECRLVFGFWDPGSGVVCRWPGHRNGNGSGNVHVHVLAALAACVFTKLNRNNARNCSTNIDVDD